MSCKPRHLNKFVSFFGIALGGAASFAGICIYRGDEYFYSKALMPVVSRLVDPELAHDACIFMTRHKLIRCRDQLGQQQLQKLETNVFNLPFSNPVGLAAGFDKNSMAIEGLGYYGLGFAEVGTVTPEPQAGNSKRRIFRILSDKALVNRCGFNNLGIDFVKDRLTEFQGSETMNVGLNLGKNKDTVSLSSDYLISLEKCHNLEAVDYFVINISSPNTPGLRDSQHKHNLEKLLDDVLSKMNSLAVKKPLLVKISPDLNDDQIKNISTLLLNKRCGSAKVAGVILTNTTISRPNTDISGDKSNYGEAGGLSGEPLRDMSTDVISKFYKYTKGKLPIIGVGGIASGSDAYEKIKAGASLVQLYTSLTYEGPPVVNKIKRELVDLLERDKITSVAHAVGLNHKN